MTSATSNSRGLTDCPIANTHQRLRHAHVLWHQASQNYQNVDVFLTNVNSLIQELRNISFMAQTEKSKFRDFDAWYQPWVERLKNDEHARWAHSTRTQIVHQSALKAASHFNVKILTYYEIPVASLLTGAESDLSTLSVLERKDFQSIIANVRYAMREQGDAIIAIERCWSAPDLRGADLLQVLGSVYGLLARMVLDAHIHLGHLGCVEQHDDADSEFPTRRGHTALLPCMMRDHAERSDYFTLRTFTPVAKGVKLQNQNVTKDDIEWRYQMKVGERIQAYDSFDPMKLYEHMVWASKRMLRKDRSLARIMMLRNGKGEWSSHMIMAGARVEKYLLMHLMAQTVREEGCDALVEVAETWVADNTVTIPELEALSSHPNRDERIKEAITVRVETRDGLRRESRTLFSRGLFGGIKLFDTVEEEKVQPIYLTPIYKVWQEQNAYARRDGSRFPVWKPEYSEPCICGSNRSFGTCCFPNLEGLDDVSLHEFETWIEKGQFEQAERYARAWVTRYGCWIRQHSAVILDKGGGTYSAKMIPIDCGALEDLFSRLERWGSRTDNVDAVADAYRKMEETVGVPAIARRLVALGAHWMLRNDRLEHGLLELGKLGDTAQITDSRALMLLAEYSNCEPDEVRSLCERAVRCALDDDERCVCLYFSAGELRKQDAKAEALNVLDQLLASSNSASMMRGALTLRWEISESKEDFGRLLEHMKAEKENDGTFSAAAYLQMKGKPDVALEVLAALLEANHPVALLIAAECDIRMKNCESAYTRISAIGSDKEGEVEVRGGVAFLRTALVLDCGMVHLKDDAIERLTALSDSEATFNRQGLIDLLKQHGNP
jgi:hypothetical protein